MSADGFDLLRAADPAAGMPEKSDDERERLRRAIVATPHPTGLGSALRRPRRLLLAVLVGVGLVLLLGGAVYAATVLLPSLPQGPQPTIGAKEWRAEYWAATRRLVLPSGEHWAGEHIPADTETGRGMGTLDAVNEAWGRWALEWAAAAKAGDDTRAGVAETWVVRLSALVAVASNGGKEWTDRQGIVYVDAAIAQARAGHFATLRRLARQLVPGLTKQEHYPTPTHFLGWIGTGNGTQTETTYAETWAEYRGVVGAVGLPPHLDLAAGRRWCAGRHDLGDGFTESFDDVWTAWWREWLAAAKAGDAARCAAAAAASRRLQELVPATFTKDGHAETLALEPDTRHDLESLAAAAEKGDMRGVRQWVAFQDVYARIMRELAGY